VSGNYRRLASELYRPDVARLVIVGEAPPPGRFFYFGDSLFFWHLRRAFGRVLPEVGEQNAAWFLALFRELGGWRTDVCEEPQRDSKGGADDVSECLERFLAQWRGQARSREAVVVVSPKRLLSWLPEEVRREVSIAIPPPGQWNAHREAFLREMECLLVRQVGCAALRAAARRVDVDDAALDFEIARACAGGAWTEEIDRLLQGHPREAGLRRGWDGTG
jgi:hypothetical protein